MIKTHSKSITAMAIAVVLVTAMLTQVWFVAELTLLCTLL